MFDTPFLCDPDQVFIFWGLFACLGNDNVYLSLGCKDGDCESASPEMAYRWDIKNVNLEEGGRGVRISDAMWERLDWPLLALKMEGARNQGMHTIKKKSASLPFDFFSLIKFFPALLRYNWHITLCKFKVYSVLIWYTYILQTITTSSVS